MGEDDKRSVNTSDTGVPQEQETNLDSSSSGMFVADILGTLGIKNTGQGKSASAKKKRKIEPPLTAFSPQFEEEVRHTKWGQDIYGLQEADSSDDRIDAEIIEMPPSKRAASRKWLLLPLLLVFASGAFFLLRIREPSPPAPDVVATYNGRNITTAELTAFIEQEDIREMAHMICPVHGDDHSLCDPTEECESHPIDSLEGYQQMTARLAMEQMVMDWAEENGMLQREDVRHNMSDLLNDATISQYATQLHDENVSTDSISSWEVQQYYDENRAIYAGKTLEEVENEIRQTLSSQKDENFFPQYIEKLKKTAGLQVNFDILKVTEPTEQEISAYYQQNQDAYTVSESATYFEIRITGSDAVSRATDASRKIRSGESFDSVASSFGESGKASEQTITIALSVGLFMFLPAALIKLTERWILLEAVWSRNLAEGLTRCVVLLVYLWLISLVPDMRRTFEYHGAEHKTVACYEAGEPLTPENAKRYTRFHPRCGTSFLFIMILIGILFYSLPFFTWDSVWERVLMKLIFFPVIAGIGYEVIRFSGRHPGNRLMHMLTMPGLWLQRITTREPSAQQLAVAIKAAQGALSTI